MSNRIPSDFRKFVCAYLEAALWAEHALGAPEDTGDGTWDTSFQSYGLDFDDIAPEAKLAAFRDCRNFWRGSYHYLREIDATDEQRGRDFWFTRQGHGAGFWDRGYGKVGELLTRDARACGPRDLYISDDGKIYGF